MIYNKELRDKLMYKYGLTTQQIDSKAVETLINAMAEGPGAENAIKEVCAEIRARLNRMVEAETRAIADLQAAKQEITGWRTQYTNDLNMVKNKCEKGLDEVKAKAEALEAAVKEYGEITDEKALNAIRLYASLLNIGNARGDRDMALKNAGYAVYAYLGGQARNVVVPNEIEKSFRSVAAKSGCDNDDGDEWGEWHR